MLPSDYAGPPASRATGKVLTLGTVTAREVAHPRLSLEWLTSLSGQPGQSSLEGQPLRFTRSPNLQTDWDIGLEFPTELVDLTSSGGVAGQQFSVGKMVYYDDRNDDGRLDWTCRSGACDLAKAVSIEYVVYVGGTKACRTSSGGLESARPTPGYNYYDWSGSTLRKLRAGESVNFYMFDGTLPQHDPSDELRRFASLLLTLWSNLGLDSGC